jgi:hypothetical protein
MVRDIQSEVTENAGASSVQRSAEIILSQADGQTRPRALLSLYTNAWSAGLSVDIPPEQFALLFSGAYRIAVREIRALSPLIRMHLARGAKLLPADRETYDVLAAMLDLLGTAGFLEALRAIPFTSSCAQPLRVLLEQGLSGEAMSIARELGRLGDFYAAAGDSDRLDLKLSRTDFLHDVQVSTLQGNPLQELTERVVRYAHASLGPEEARALCSELLMDPRESAQRGVLDGARAVPALLLPAQTWQLPPALRAYWVEVTEGIPDRTLPDDRLTQMLTAQTRVVLDVNPREFTSEELQRLALGIERLSPLRGRVRELESPYFRHILRQVLWEFDRFGPGSHPRSPVRALDEKPTEYDAFVLQILYMQAFLSQVGGSARGVKPLTFVHAIERYLIDEAPDVFFIPRLQLPPRRSNPSATRNLSESLGEALGVLFLEEAVNFNLATLARPPESSKKKAPDFSSVYAGTRQMLIECKGRSTWQGFQSARRDALQQLGKGKKRPKLQGRLVGARAFACRLYLGTIGDTRQSVLAIEDPPSPDFPDEIGSEGLDQLTRSHAAAQARAASLPALSNWISGDEANADQRRLATQEFEGRAIQTPGFAELIGATRELRVPFGPPGEGDDAVPVRLICGIERQRVGQMLERDWGGLRQTAEPSRGLEAMERDFIHGNSFGLLREQPGAYFKAADGSMIMVAGGALSQRE